MPRARELGKNPCLNLPAYGRSVSYRVHWVWEDTHRDERARSGGGFEGALPA